MFVCLPADMINGYKWYSTVYINGMMNGCVPPKHGPLVFAVQWKGKQRIMSRHFLDNPMLNHVGKTQANCPVPTIATLLELTVPSKSLAFDHLNNMDNRMSMCSHCRKLEENKEPTSNRSNGVSSVICAARKLPLSQRSQDHRVFMVPKRDQLSYSQKSLLKKFIANIDTVGYV